MLVNNNNWAVRVGNYLVGSGGNDVELINCTVTKNLGPAIMGAGETWGTVIATNSIIYNNIDVDGTANLDVVDVDGTANFADAVTVGTGVTLQPHGGVSIAGITTIGGTLIANGDVSLGNLSTDQILTGGRFVNNLIDFLIIFFSKPFLPQCKEATILFLKSATNIGMQSAV